MRDELGDLVFCDTDVMVVDQATSCTCGEDVLVPAHDSNAGLVAVHASKLRTFLNIPNLDLTGA